MQKCTVALLLLSLFILSSCFPGIPPEKAPQTHYYTLSYDPASLDKEKLPYVINILDFSQGPHCDTQKMVFSRKKTSKEHYYYHRWRAEPAELLTYFLRRDLRENKIFTAVTGPGFNKPCTHQLEGTVEEFEEVDRNGSSYARAQINVTLLKCNQRDISKRVLVQKTYRIKKAMPSKKPAQLARAMSQVMAELSRQLAKDIYELVK